MSDFIRRLSLVLFLLGAALIFAAERYAIVPSLSLLSGSVFFLMALLLDFVSLRGSGGLKRQYLKVALGWKSAWILALILFLLSRRFILNQPITSNILTGLSAVFIVLGAFVAFGIEAMALRPQSFDGQNAVSQRWRSSLTLGLIFVGLFGLNYAANKKDHAFDLSFAKTTKAGETTLKVVSRLSHPIRVGVFNSRNSEVLPLVREYLESLAGNNLKIEYYDKDFNPVQAEEFRVAKNGQIVLMDGEKRQRFEVGDRMEEARRNLRALDASFQKSLLQLTSDPGIIYFTSTHGEMLWESGSPLRTMAIFENILRSQNFRSRRLTALFQEVPPETKVLGIIGPTSGFSSQEIEALKRYIEKGGRILLALDIDQTDLVNGVSNAGDELPKFLDAIGLHYVTNPLAHDERFVPISRQKSDHYVLTSNNYAQHPATATLKTNSDRFPMISFRAGSFEIGSQTADWTFTPLVSSITGSFIDRNGNMEADPDEKRGNYPMVVAGESKSKGKIVVFGDASALADGLMKYQANQIVGLDAVRWLSDRTEEAGVTESEEDVLIRHENKKELLIFHGSIYLMPLLVLAFGFYVNRRKRTKI
jgi:hypothetical protein